MERRVRSAPAMPLTSRPDMMRGRWVTRRAWLLTSAARRTTRRESKPRNPGRASQIPDPSSFDRSWRSRFHLVAHNRLADAAKGPRPKLRSRVRTPSSASLLGVCNDDRRAELHVMEEPLGVRDVHADAAVRRRVADRRVVRRAVDADARRRESHPACAERVARARWNRLLARRPGRVRRQPPRVQLLVDDAENPGRRRVHGLTGRHAELPHQLRAPVVAQLVGATPNDDDGTELDDRPRRLEHLHGNADAPYLR